MAHEDIEPTKEWQNEIEVALHSMDALTAILTEGFRESSWCDQEIGVAVGRDVLIVPIRRGIDPYGFIGKYQGIQSLGKNSGEVARAVFDSLISSDKTKVKVLRSLCLTISQSSDAEESLKKIAILKEVKNIPKDNLDQLKGLIEENELLMSSAKLKRAVNALFKLYNVPSLSSAKMDEIKFDYDIPF